MTYRAIIGNGYDIRAQRFNTYQQAEQWILSNNNNLETESYIQTLDDNDNVLDCVCYTVLYRKKE